MTLDPWPQNNAFAGAIAGPLLYRETRWQKELNLAYWPRRFQNNLYTTGRNNSSLNRSSYSIGWKTEPLRAAHGVRSLPRVDHVFDL